MLENIEICVGGKTSCIEGTWYPIFNTTSLREIEGFFVFIDRLPKNGDFNTECLFDSDLNQANLSFEHQPENLKRHDQ